MTELLFRKEVMEARQTPWLGGISLAQPLSLWLLTGVAIIATAGIVALLVFGEYTRRTRVTGTLVPSKGIASITAPTIGTVTEVRIVEGQRVLAGDVIAVVAVPSVTLGDGDTAQALQATIAQRQKSVVDSYASQRLQLEAQQDGLDVQLGGGKAELRQIEVELSTRRELYELANQDLERFRGLRDRQFVTELQLQQQKATALDQLAAVQALERQALSLSRQLAQLDQARKELPSRQATLDAAQQRDRASLIQESIENAGRSQSVIKAPVDGIVGTLLAQVGQAVEAGQPMLSLLPATGVLEAHLLVPSRAVGFVEAGDTVLLRYQAFPYQTFGHYGGKVVRVSRSALSSGEGASLVGGAQAGEPVYRIIVSLDRPTIRAFGKDEMLKPGMLLEADILGEKRKLWEWAVGPVRALGGSVSVR